MKSTVPNESKARKSECDVTWASAPDVLTVEEAAALVRIPRNSAYEAVKLGLLPAVNFGKRRIRVSKMVLQQVFGLSPKDMLSTAALGHGKA